MKKPIIPTTPDKQKGLEEDFKQRKYNAAFEEKMMRSQEDKKAGRFKTIKTDDLWK